LCTIARGQRVGEEFGRKFHHVVERLAPRLKARGIGRCRWQRQAGHYGKTFDGLRKRHTFGLHQKIEDVAVLAGGKIEPRLLLVIDEKRRRLLLLKRRQTLPLAPGFLQFHAPPHDFRNRKPGAQLIEELGRKAHFEFCGESGLTDYRYSVDERSRYQDDRFHPLYTGAL